MYLRGAQKGADQIFDVARSTALFVTEKKFEYVRRKLEGILHDGMVEDTNPAIRCVRIKDRYKDGGGARAGYSDMQCILQVPIGAKFKAHLVELQINLNSVNHHKHLVHSLYDITRISCDGQIPAAKLVKVQTRLKRLELLMEQHRFWHPAGPWKDGNAARKLYQSIVKRIAALKVSGTGAEIKMNKGECWFCSILQELVYPHLYKREMSMQKVKTTMVLAGVERTLMLPAVSEEEVKLAEEAIYDLARQWDGRDYKRAFPMNAYSHVDKWVASKAARTAIKIKEGK